MADKYLEDLQAQLAELQSNEINRLVESIASERDWLVNGAAAHIRTIRLMSLGTIRRAQRRLAKIANDLMASTLTGAA